MLQVQYNQPSFSRSRQFFKGYSVQKLILTSQIRSSKI